MRVSLSHTDPKRPGVGGQTCRRIHHIISGSISLRYSVELAANGMRHGSCFFSFGKVQCLEMLAAHEAAWRTLSWSDNASVDMLVGWGPPISVSGNVIGFVSKPDVPRKELLLLRTPSKLRNVTMKSWRLRLPYDVHDVCMDSSQNLLIYYTGYVSCTCVLRRYLHAHYLSGSNPFMPAPF